MKSGKDKDMWAERGGKGEGDWEEEGERIRKIKGERGGDG